MIRVRLLAACVVGAWVATAATNAVANDCPQTYVPLTGAEADAGGIPHDEPGWGPPGGTCWVPYVKRTEACNDRLGQWTSAVDCCTYGTYDVGSCRDPHSHAGIGCCKISP